MVKPDTLRIIVETTTPDGVCHARELVFTISEVDNMGYGELSDAIQYARDQFPKEVDDYYAAIT